MEDDHEDERLHADRSFRALRHYRRVKARSKQTVFMPVHANRKPILRAVNRALQALLDEARIYVVRMYDVDEVINLHKDFKWNGEVVYNTEYLRANEGQVIRKLEEAGLNYTELSRFLNFNFEDLFLVDGQVRWELFQPQLPYFGHEQPPVPMDDQPPVPMDEQLQDEWVLEIQVPAGEQPQVPVDEQLQNEWVLEIQVPAGEQPQVPVDEQPPVPVDEQLQNEWALEVQVPAGEQPQVPMDEQPPVPVDEQPPVPVDEQPPVPVDEE